MFNGKQVYMYLHRAQIKMLLRWLFGNIITPTPLGRQGGPQRRLDMRHQMSPCHVHQHKMYRNVWQVSITHSRAS